MSKNLLKALTLCLSVVMLVSLAACGQGGEKQNQGASSATAQATSVSDTQKDQATEVKEPITVKAFIGPFNNTGIQDDDVAKEIFEKKFGITIDFMPAGDQYEQKLAALMAGGDIADLICFKKRQDVEQAIKANVIMSLDDLVAKGGQNILKNASAMIQFNKDNVSAGTGKLYSLGTGIGPAGDTDRYMWGFYVKWDLYKQLGSPEINTYMDLIPLLKKMKELQPKAGNDQSSIVMTLWKDWDSTFMNLNGNIPAMYGHNVDSYGLNFIDVNVQAKEAKDMLGPDSLYIKGLEFYNKFYQEGLLDPDSITQKFDNAVQKIQQGRLLFSWHSWFADMYNSSDIVKNSPMSAMMPIFPKDCTIENWANNWVGGDYQWAIGAGAKNADRIMELLNYMSSIDGYCNIIDGPEGKYWTLKDGKAAFTDDTIQKLKGGNLSYTLNKYAACFNVLGDFVVDPRTNEGVKYPGWSSYQKAMYTPAQDDYSKTYGVLNPVEYLKKFRKVIVIGDESKFTGPAPADIMAITQKCGDVVKTYSWKAILSKTDADYQKVINDMIAKLKSLEYDKAVEWNIKEYENAKQKAAKYTQK